MTSNENRHAAAWFDVSTPDAIRTAEFYSSLFGWQVTTVDDTYSLMSDARGNPVGGIGLAGSDSPYTGTTTYFAVDDVATTLERVVSVGGTIVFGPVETPMGKIGAFLDPDGNRIGVVGS
ncbi:hypothetical protein SAMN05421505_10191 [Sinosporangium album]|uniref:VOC domain-containing protein n=1 Tax=Sinosporangium album TaxID=504805 RepID=A0A1G7QR76_9ACTN|nr:VOC family protein [Sinosporangium album]SDG01028.1 hypothetical protein SAMN05421505_10191 [Sinosporangium album]